MLIMRGSFNLRLKLTSGLNKGRKEDRRTARKAGRTDKCKERKIMLERKTSVTNLSKNCRIW